MSDKPGKTPITADEIMADDLYGVLIQARGEAQPLPVAVIDRKLRAAEDYYEHDLQLLFGEQRVASSPQARGLTVSTATTANDYDVAEPAYDYDRRLFTEERWAYTQLSYRPVLSITRAFFAYPGMDPAQGWTIPPTWIQLDHKFGKFQLVPTKGDVAFLQLNAWIMSLLAGGRGVPMSLYVDYVAGLSHDDLLRHHMDLLEGVRLRTVLSTFGILSMALTRGLGSRSLSQDGQAKSESFVLGKYGPYSGQIQLAMEQEQAIRDAWKRSERGVVCAFV